MFDKLGQLFGGNDVITISSDGPNAHAPVNSIHAPIIVRDSDEEDEADSPNPQHTKVSCQRKIFSTEIGKNTCRALISVESNAARDRAPYQETESAVLA